MLRNKQLIPPRIICAHKSAEEASYIKFALNQLSILERLMSFQSINEGYRPVSPLPGVLVESWSSFSQRTIKISVSPVRPPAGQIITVKKEEKKYDEYVYFIRFKYPDPSGAYSSINMDRIIIYAPKYDGDLAYAADPADNFCRANSFVPGQGTITLDADPVNGEVYYPTGLTAEQEQAILVTAAAYANALPSSAEPTKGLRNLASEWLADGQVTSVIDSATQGGYGNYIPHIPVDLDISEGLTVNGVTWWFQTDSPYAEDLTAWKNKWSPLYGGDTGITKDAYSWIGLDDVKSYYGDFCVYKTSAAPNYVQIIHSLIAEAYSGYIIVVSENIKLDGSFDNYLASGRFYTPIQAVGMNTFFIIGLGRRGYTRAFSTYVAPAYYSGVGTELTGGMQQPESYYISVKATYSDSSFEGLMTPLETIGPTDYRAINSYSSTCSELSGLYWDDFLSVKGEYESTLANANLTPYFTPAKNAVLNAFGHSNVTDFTHDPLKYAAFYFKNWGTAPERDWTYSVNAIDEELEKGSEEWGRFFSLSFFEEIRATGKTSACAYLDGSTYTECYCNGTMYASYGLSPVTKNSSVGAIIYIFAPEEFSWVIDGITYYWDIHSARRDSGAINPYRCLDLEEHVMGAMQEIQAKLDDDSVIPKMTTGFAHPMGHYGVTITDGFTVKL